MTGNSRRGFGDEETLITDLGDEEIRSRTETVSHMEDDGQKSGRKSVKFAMDRSVKFKEAIFKY